jgi:hypothetical protein
MFYLIPENGGSVLLKNRYLLQNYMVSTQKITILHFTVLGQKLHIVYTKNHWVI